MNKTFSQKIVSATKWSGISEIGAKLVVPLVNMILARLLTPEDFGIVATLTMIVSFAEVFSESGCPKYLIQHEFKNEDDLEEATNVAFWTNTFLAMLMWMVIILFASPIVNMAGSPGSEKAVIIMSAQIPLLSIADMLKARFRRSFNFKSLFIARITTALIPLVVTVPLALICKSYWALVIGTLFRDIVNVIVLAYLFRWKPRFSYSIRKLREMFSFTMWTIGENITIWLSLYAGTFIVGTALSAHMLGLYKTTLTTVSSYMTIITAIITPVMFSALSRCQDDTLLFNDVFFRFQRLVALVVFPLGVGIWAFRDLATSLLLGSQWAETADFLGMWALTSAIVIVFSNMNSEMIRSKGKPQLSVLVQVLHLVVIIPALRWAVTQSYEILALTQCIAKLEIVFVSVIIVRICFGMRVFDVLKNVYAPLCSALIMGLLSNALLMISHSFAWQFVAVLLSTISYFMMICVFPSGRKLLCEIPQIKKVLSKIIPISIRKHIK